MYDLPYHKEKNEQVGDCHRNEKKEQEKYFPKKNAMTTSQIVPRNFYTHETPSRIHRLHLFQWQPNFCTNKS